MAPTDVAPQDPLDFTNRYNTPIPPEKQPAFDQWATTQKQTTGKDPRGDRYNYDVNGFWLANSGTDARGHGSDDFKKPNHPTFSDQSEWNGVDGYVGGKWADATPKARGTYTPSVANMAPEEGLQQYFDKAEPDTQLLPTEKVPQPSGRNGQYQISDFVYRVKPQVPLAPQPQAPSYRARPQLADGAAPGKVEQDGQTGYKALALAPDPIPTAQSRWTRTPIAFGQTYNTPDENSASTLYNEKGDQAVRIEANMGSDPASNSRMLRHESIHALLAASPADKNRIAADPAVAKASQPIVNKLKSAGYRGDVNTELPAYMAAFSNSKDEWTGGVPLEQRNAYTDAYANALGKQDPQTAAKYRRMLIDSSPGTPAAAINLMPGPAAAAYRSKPGQ